MIKNKFFNKNEFFGLGSIYNLSKIIKKNNFKQILVVTGKKSYQSSGLKNFLAPLLKDTEYLIKNDFDINPKYKDIKRIGSSLKSMKFDAIIAGGGGSVIDFAKCLNVYLSTCNDYDQDGIINPLLIKGEFLPMIAIPTTAGTGSEATHFAVAYIKNEKISVANKELRPQYAIIDPVFCFGSPSYISACCAFDALCQAIESYWSKGATTQSKKFAKEAIILISTNIVKAIQADCHLSRESLSKGAFLAGKAINISKTTAPHALSYSLTSHLDIPHGHAVALTLGKFYTLNKSIESQKKTLNISGLKKHLRNLEDIKKFMGWTMESCFELEWSKLMIQCGLDLKIDVSNLKNITLDTFTTSVNKERLSNHPLEISEKIISKIYSELFS